MKFNDKFLKDLWNLLEDHHLDFNVLNQIVQYREERLADIENQISQMRSEKPLIKNYRDYSKEPYCLYGYDPVLKKVIVTQVDREYLNDLIGIEQFIFGPYSFVPKSGQEKQADAGNNQTVQPA